jgi:hypothetical protein
MEVRVRVRRRPVVEDAPQPSGADDYKVGYGRPPKEHQFRKNVSGNAKGRPKGARSTAEAAKAYLDGSVMVRQQGVQKRMKRREVLVHQMYERAVKGDNRAAAILLDLDFKARGGIQPAADPSPLHSPEADDLEILAHYAEQLLKRKDG